MDRGPMNSEKTGAKPAPSQELHPRDLAVRILTRVLSDNLTLDMAIDEVAPAESRAWLQDVCSGVLRWKGRLDLAIDTVSLKKKPSGWLRKMLLVTAYQLIAQDRAPAAQIVSETVAAIRKREGAPPASFANAVLRKVSEHARSWAELSVDPAAPVEIGAAQASLPVWIWKRIVAQHGREWAQAYAQASLQRPVTWARARSPEWVPSWGEAGPIPCAWRFKDGGAVLNKEGFTEGRFFIQDISSQWLIREVSARVKAALPGPKLTALDPCAAPGGKSAGLELSGFSVTSSDASASRVLLLEDTRERLGLSFEIVQPDEVKALEPCDLVWVDAPCTGSGILRRHPDVRWLRREQELAGLTGTQTQLCREGWARVKPGGFFVYSVCSVLTDEGIGVLKAAGLAEYVQERWLLAPHLEPYGDGFWAALMRKPS